MNESINIIISGSVAVGKTFIEQSIISSIKQLETYSMNIYPEFIQDITTLDNDPFALKILENRFKDNISPLTFQNFILDKWERNIKYNKDKKADINIFERLPDDAVEVFAKNSLTEIEYATQIEKLSQFSKDIISYKTMKKDETIWIRYENSLNKPISPFLLQLVGIIKTGNYKNIVIEVQSPSIYENYQYRNRKEEFYTPDQLISLYENYCKYMEETQKNIDCELINIY